MAIYTFYLCVCIGVFMFERQAGRAGFGGWVVTFYDAAAPRCETATYAWPCKGGAAGRVYIYTHMYIYTHICASEYTS